MCTTENVFRYASLLRDGISDFLGPQGFYASTPKEILENVYFINWRIMNLLMI